MADCVIVQPIHEAGIDLLRQAGLSVFVSPKPELSEMGAELRDAMAAITRNAGFPAVAFALAPRLLVIGSHGTGTDAIDRAAADQAGVKIVNTPGANARAVAEHTMALILACAKSIQDADLSVRRGDTGFRDRRRTVELQGKTLGLVGYGRIARLVGQLGKAFGMQIQVFSRHAGELKIAADGFRPAPTLESLCQTADIVSLHAIPSAHTVFDRRHFRLLRRNTIFVNTARGSLVDEAALVQMLREGRLAMAALDVVRDEPIAPENPLTDCPNLLLTPHIGGLSDEAMKRTAVKVAQKVLEALAAKNCL